MVVRELWIIYSITTFIIWIVLMVNAWQGKKYKLPLLGQWAQDWSS